MLLSVVYLEVALFGAMVQLLLERRASQMSYMWEIKDTHGMKTLALTNLTS